MKKTKLLAFSLATRDLLLAAIILCALCIDLNAQEYKTPKREFRGGWLSTVWAIDWPGMRDNTVAAEKSQKAQMIEILDRYKAANMNVCFFQVRGFSDAFYNSAYEPWSKYLCGERGKAPNYDPFQFVIEECHKRGIECHAWINPYRYSTSTDTYGTLPTDYSNTHPEWLLDCGGTVILNPGMPEVRQRIVDVVVDILSKYDVDGIVFDDYFYPNGGMTDAKDQAQYDAYNPDSLERGDWRRHQVNLMVKDVHDVQARRLLTNMASHHVHQVPIGNITVSIPTQLHGFLKILSTISRLKSIGQLALTPIMPKSYLGGVLWYTNLVATITQVVHYLILNASHHKLHKARNIVMSKNMPKIKYLLASLSVKTS